jgi:hypothetical protein
MRQRLLELKVATGIGNTRNQIMWHALPIRSANTDWIFPPSGSPLSAMILPAYKDKYDMTESI